MFQDMKKVLIFIVCLIFIVSCKFKLGNDPNNGVQYENYPDGTVKSQYTLRNGLREGIVRNYTQEGKLFSTAEYKNDLRDGWLINYNEANGKLVLKFYFKKDTQNGPAFHYYDQGQLFRESNYVKGRVNGVIKTYWPNGNLKAENTFKMGKPGLGLKEYEKDGKTIINQPNILVKEINQATLLNKVILKISISDGTDDAEVYVDDFDLEDGKFFNPYSHSLTKDDGGVASIEYHVPRGTTLIRKIHIVAKLKTKFGNTLILHKYCNLAI